MQKTIEVIKETIPNKAKKAIFAPGCFWCLEATFERTEGVLGAINGYAGGTTSNPTYEQVCSQNTDYREAVLVYYDPSQIDYQQLVTIFIENINPNQADGQFVDRGFSYTTAIFYQNASEKDIALKFVKMLKQQHIFKQINVAILPHTSFYQAEDYHQNFYLKNPQQYQQYYQSSGRQDYKDCQACDLRAMQLDADNPAIQSKD